MDILLRLISKVSSWASGRRPPPPAAPPPPPPPQPVVHPVHLVLAKLSQHPPDHADIESGSRSAPTAGGFRLAEEDKEDQGLPAPPFHVRMSGSTTSIAACLVTLAFLLLLKVPSIPSALLPVFCYLGMIDFLAGSCIYFLHVARPPSRGIALIQATAAVLGLTAAAVDGVVVCYLLLVPAQFWGLALVLLASVAGFLGFVVWAGCSDPDP